MTPLRDYLLLAYGSCGRPHRDPTQDLSIRIDDLSGEDVSRLFCRVSVRVPERHGTGFILIMQNAPLGADAGEFIEQHGGVIVDTPLGTTATLELRVTSITLLRNLSALIRNTVGRGRRYDDRNWKWSCPRTANTLGRLADVIKAYRLQGRHPA